MDNLKDNSDVRILNSLKLLKELTNQYAKVDYMISGYKNGE